MLVLEVSQNDFLLHDEASKKKKEADKAKTHAQIEAGNLEHLTRYKHFNKQRLPIIDRTKTQK